MFVFCSQLYHVLILLPVFSVSLRCTWWFLHRERRLFQKWQFHTVVHLLHLAGSERAYYGVHKLMFIFSILCLCGGARRAAAFLVYSMMHFSDFCHLYGEGGLVGCLTAWNSLFILSMGRGGFRMYVRTKCLKLRSISCAVAEMGVYWIRSLFQSSPWESPSHQPLGHGDNDDSEDS